MSRPLSNPVDDELEISRLRALLLAAGIDPDTRSPPSLAISAECDVLQQENARLRDEAARTTGTYRLALSLGQAQLVASRAELERVDVILQSAVDFAIIATDLQGEITIWNEGAARILGWDAAEIEGQSARVIFTPEDCAESILGSRDVRGLGPGPSRRRTLAPAQGWLPLLRQRHNDAAARRGRPDGRISQDPARPNGAPPGGGAAARERGLYPVHRGGEPGLHPGPRSSRVHRNDQRQRACPPRSILAGSAPRAALDRFLGRRQSACAGSPALGCGRRDGLFSRPRADARRRAALVGRRSDTASRPWGAAAPRSRRLPRRYGEPRGGPAGG